MALDSYYTLAQCSFAPYILLAWLPRFAHSSKAVCLRHTAPHSFEPIWTSLSFASPLAPCFAPPCSLALLCFLQHIDPLTSTSSNTAFFASASRLTLRQVVLLTPPTVRSSQSRFSSYSIVIHLSQISRYSGSSSITIAEESFPH